MNVISTSNTITLAEPITRGDTKITTITLRKPNSGALRGASLRGLLDMETDSITTVLPRISEPPLTNAEVARLDPSDLVSIALEIATFLVPKHLLPSEADASYQSQ